MPVQRHPIFSAEELSHFRNHILEALREDGVVCLECGALLQAMPSHLRRHGLTIADYREKWGYNRGTALVSPAHYDMLRQKALARNFGALSPPGAIRKAIAARLRAPALGRLETRLTRRAAIRARFAAGWRPADKIRKVENATLRDLVAEGLTFREIAVRTGLTYHHIRGRIRALGLVGPGIKPQRRHVPADELFALRREIAAGPLASRAPAPEGTEGGSEMREPTRPQHS